jgi:hypothetical protein
LSERAIAFVLKKEVISCESTAAIILWPLPLELEMGCCLLDEPRDADINRSCARLEAHRVGPDLACSVEVDAKHAEGV